MIPYETGDVILVPFPFSNQLAIKKRPAIIISSLQYNLYSSDVIIIAVTSQNQILRGFGDSLIEHWQEAGLLKKSVIKPAIATIEQNLIMKKLGILNESDFLNLQNNLKVLLNLS